MTISGYRTVFCSFLLGGILLMATALVKHAITNPHEKYINEPWFLFFAMCLWTVAFVTNLICALKLGKCWGRGGLSDADWFDKAANLIIAGMCLLIAIRVWFPHLPGHS
jgi:hypothetical protein